MGSSHDRTPHLWIPVLLLALLLAGAVGCSEDSDPEVIGPGPDHVELPDGFVFPQQPWSVDAFMPIDIGNRWRYEGNYSVANNNQETLSLVEVVGDSLLGGLTGRVVVQDSYLGGSLVGSERQVAAIQQDTLCLWMSSREEWYPFVELMLQDVLPGDTLRESAAGASTYVLSRVEAIGEDVEFGGVTFPNCVVVVDSVVYGATGGSVEARIVNRTTYTPGIGTIRSITEGYSIDEETYTPTFT